jgi:hypothetical protein
MGPFLLLLLTVSPQTGEQLSSSVVGDPYVNIGDCMHAAISRGPIKAQQDGVGLLVCKAAGSDYAGIGPAPQPNSNPS